MIRSARMLARAFVDRPCAARHDRRTGAFQNATAVVSQRGFSINGKGYSMKKRGMRLAALLVAAVFLFAGCTRLQKMEGGEAEFKQLDPVEVGRQIAVIATDKGDITIALYPEYAPNAVENFIKLAEEGYYDDTPIFGVEPKLALLAGSDDESGGTGKTVINNGKPYKNEFNQKMWHFSGTISMASNKKHKADSRFFILGTITPENAVNSIVGESKKDESQSPKDVLTNAMTEAGFPENVIEKYNEVGGMPNFDQGHAPFGQVIKGLEVVDEIIQIPVDENYKPTESLKIQSVTVSKVTQENLAEYTQQ